jgi:hypothetical protein
VSLHADPPVPGQLAEDSVNAFGDVVGAGSAADVSGSEARDGEWRARVAPARAATAAAATRYRHRAARAARGVGAAKVSPSWINSEAYAGRLVARAMSGARDSTSTDVEKTPRSSRWMVTRSTPTESMDWSVVGMTPPSTTPL